MGKYYKTYSAPGHSEWLCRIPIDRMKVDVHFRGGGMGSYGYMSGSYSTTSEGMQYIIENSDYFKKGQIVLERVVERQEKTSAVKDSKGNDSAAKAPKTATYSSGGETPDTEASEAGVSGMATVKVDCLDDAREYLKEKFGCRNVRTRSDAQRMGVEHGVEFEFGS